MNETVIRQPALLHLVALGIFVVVIALCGMRHSEWGFGVDDCGILYGSQVSSCDDLKNLLTDTDHYALSCPSNYQRDSKSFANVYYRPLCRLFFAPQGCLFGVEPYGYFFIMILFHAINAVLFFYLAYRLTRQHWLSLWMALFFAFHRNVGMFMGWIAAQNYPIALMFVLVALLIVIKPVQRWPWVSLASLFLLTLLALFTFEFTLFLPPLITLLWYARNFFKEELGIIWSPYFFVSMISVMWGALATFMLTRWVVFQGAGTSESIVSIVSQRSGRVYADIASLCAELCNITVIPSGNFMIKSTLLVVCAGIFGWLFYNNRYKQLIVVLIVGMGLALWPALLRPYTSRHSYFALPFFILILGLLIRYARQYYSWHGKQWAVVWVVLSSMLVLNGYQSLSLMKESELSSCAMLKSYRQLCANPTIQGRTLCFIGLPVRYATALAQAVWFHGVNKNFPIYYDPLTFTTGPNNESECSITPMQKGLRMRINKPEQGWFCDMGTCFRMGTVRIITRHANNAPTEMDYVFDDTYLQQNLLFITWDYTAGRFSVRTDLEIK